MQNLSAPASSGAATQADVPLLVVDDLRTYFRTDQGLARAVDGVSFSVRAGRTVALVGESGCGKTVTALSVLRLLPIPPAEIAGGRILLEGRGDLLRLGPRELRRVRGGDVAMIFQEPATSLNPVYTIGQQIAEAIRLHRLEGPQPVTHVRQEVLRVLEEVRISEPARRLRQYPHELSGGMKQRAMIAMALACRPRLLIADEPTTALDVTIQARILELLRQSQAVHRMGLLLITHDLGVVAEMAEEVVVMYAGKVVEHAAAEPLFASPAHPYTRGLFASLPRVDRRETRLRSIAGSVPPPTRLPSGCRFKDRCPLATSQCDNEPPLVEIRPGHRSACWYAEDVLAGRTTPRESSA